MTLPLVSVVFVTYRRLDLLERTLSTFRANTDYPSLQLIVADDGSPPAVQAGIRALPFDEYVLSPRNRGLGANENAGIAAAKGDYVLVLQDDWECRGPSDYLRRAVALMERHPRVGIVRFYGYPFVVPAPVDPEGDPDAHWLEPSGVATYSDTPHLRSRRCIERIGPYREDLWMADCENDYVERFAAQDEFRAAVFESSYNSVFLHIGEEQSHRTSSLRQRVLLALAALGAPLKKRAPRAHAFARRVVKETLDVVESGRRRIRAR